MVLPLFSFPQPQLLQALARYCWPGKFIQSFLKLLFETWWHLIGMKKYQHSFKLLYTGLSDTLNLHNLFYHLLKVQICGRSIKNLSNDKISHKNKQKLRKTLKHGVRLFLEAIADLIS